MAATQNRQGILPGITEDRRKSLAPPATPSARIHTNQKGLVIGGIWKVSSDPYTIIVSRKRGKKWEAESYCMKLQGALSYLVDQNVRESDMENLADAVRKIEALRSEIVALVAGDTTKWMMTRDRAASLC